MSVAVPSPEADRLVMGNGQVGAVILAGGLARRMGGVDKGLVMLGGQTMVARVVERIRPAVDRLVINANRHREDYQALGVEVVADKREGFIGPLAGLASGMATLRCEYVFMCPCDSPFVTGALVHRLGNALRDDEYDIAVARDAMREQPVFCMVRQRVATSLAAFLDSGERKIDRWYGAERTVAVDCADMAEVFRNINTDAERLAAEQGLIE